MVGFMPLVGQLLFKSFKKKNSPNSYFHYLIPFSVFIYLAENGQRFPFVSAWLHCDVKLVNQLFIVFNEARRRANNQIQRGRLG